MLKQDGPHVPKIPQLELQGMGRTVLGSPGGLAPPDPVSEASQLDPMDPHSWGNHLHSSRVGEVWLPINLPISPSRGQGKLGEIKSPASSAISGLLQFFSLTARRQRSSKDLIHSGFTKCMLMNKNLLIIS